MDMDTLCDWSCPSQVVSSQVCIKDVCICEPQLPQQLRYFNMDNEVQVLLALLSLLAVVVHLSFAFYHVATAHMLRR